MNASTHWLHVWTVALLVSPYAAWESARTFPKRNFWSLKSPACSGVRVRAFRHFNARTAIFRAVLVSTKNVIPSFTCPQGV